MRTKTIPMVTIGMIMIAAVMVSYLIARPIRFVSQRSMPVFMGEEIVVEKGVKAVTAITTKTAVKADTAVKAGTAPAPTPKIAAPLPIVPPQIAYSVLPVYPETALEEELEGIVLLSIFVGTSGSPEKVEVKSSSGVTELDGSAIAAVSKWSFEPASQGGKAIASWFEVPVRFALK